MTIANLRLRDCTYSINHRIITLYSKKEEKDKLKNKILEIKCADDK